MQVIGFNLAKISADKSPNFKTCNINTNIEFSNIEKDNIELLKEDSTIKISFKFTVGYEDQEKKKEILGSVVFEGNIILLLGEDESKEILKSWKKKEVHSSIKIPLFNIILKKCSVRALNLEEEIGLPFHAPLPQIKPQDKKDN